MTGILKKPQEPKSLFHEQTSGVKIALRKGRTSTAAASKARTKPRQKQGAKADMQEHATLSGRARSLSMELVQGVARKRGSVVEGISYLNEKRKSLFRPKEKVVRFDDVVVTFESPQKHRLAEGEDFEKVEIPVDSFVGTNINDLEYDFEELVAHSTDSLDLELFEKLVEGFDDEFSSIIAREELEGMLSRVMLSGKYKFAQLLIEHVNRHEEEYNSFEILSNNFFRKRSKEFFQDLLLTLIHQGDKKMVKLALDYGYRDVEALNSVVSNSGDMVLSEWLKHQADNGSGGKKKKKRKKKKKETKYDKLLDRVEVVEIKTITYEPETVLTAALKHEDTDLLDMLLDAGARPEKHDYIAYRLAARYALVQYIPLFLRNLRKYESDHDTLRKHYEEVFKILFLEAGMERRYDVLQWGIMQLEEDIELQDVDIAKTLDDALRSLYAQGTNAACVFRFKLMHGIITLMFLKEQLLHSSPVYSRIGAVSPKVLHRWFVVLLDKGEYKGHEVMQTLLSNGLATYLADMKNRNTAYIPPHELYVPDGPRVILSNKQTDRRKIALTISRKRTAAIIKAAIPTRRATFQEKEIVFGLAAKNDELEMLQHLLALIHLPDVYLFELMIIAARFNALETTIFLLNESIIRAQVAKNLTPTGSGKLKKVRSRKSMTIEGMNKARRSVTRRLSARGSSQTETRRGSAQHEVFGQVNEDEEVTLEESLDRAFEEAIKMESIDTARVLLNNDYEKIEKGVTYIAQSVLKAVTTTSRFSERYLSELFHLMRDNCDDKEKDFISKLLSHHTNQSKTRNIVNLKIIFDGCISAEEMKGEITPEHYIEAIEFNRKLTPLEKKAPAKGGGGMGLLRKLTKSKGDSEAELGRKAGSGRKNGSGRKGGGGRKNGSGWKRKIGSGSEKKKRKSRNKDGEETSIIPPKPVSEVAFKEAKKRAALNFNSMLLDEQRESDAEVFVRESGDSSGSERKSGSSDDEFEPPPEAYV